MSVLAEIRKEDERRLGCRADEILSQLPQRLSHGVLRWATQTPDQVAIVAEDCQLTYAELAAAVEQTRQQLATTGLRPGDRVMLIAENCAQLMCLLLALSELDAIAVVINARLSAREIDLIAEDCDPRLIICTQHVSKDADQHGHRMGAVVTGFPLGELLVKQLETSAAEPDAKDAASLVLAMIYTTGTTGMPKGVMLSHQNLTFIAFVSGKLRGIEQGDEVYCVLPMSHVFGLSAVSCSVLFAGGCVHLVSRFNATSALKTLAENKIAGFLGVPTMYNLMLDAMSSDWQAKALRFIYSGGSPLDPDLKQRVEKAFNLPLNNGYGLTETGPTVSQTRQQWPTTSTSVGFCLPGEEIKVVDEQGVEVGAGEIGELWVRGPNVMRGYFRNPKATAEVMHGDWFNTGDLAYQDDKGELFIAGRSKELIIRSGFNVYPPEVEAVLAKHPQVGLCAVLGEQNEGDELIVAYIQPAPGVTLDQKSVIEHARENLAGYKVPNSIVVMDSLPTAPSGKILKHQLRGAA